MFTVQKSQPGGVDLKWLALHELGHSLGLEHSSQKGAIMYPIYSGYHPGLQLHRDDILGIQQLYGKLDLACNFCPNLSFLWCSFLRCMRDDNDNDHAWRFVDRLITRRSEQISPAVDLPSPDCLTFF